MEKKKEKRGDKQWRSGGGADRLRRQSGGSDNVKIGGDNGKNGHDKGHQASREFWGRQNTVAPGADNPRYAAGGEMKKEKWGGGKIIIIIIIIIIMRKVTNKQSRTGIRTRKISSAVRLSKWYI